MAAVRNYQESTPGQETRSITSGMYQPPSDDFPTQAAGMHGRVTPDDLGAGVLLANAVLRRADQP